MKKKTIIWVVVVLLIAAGGVWYFTSRTKKVAVTITTAKPELGYISRSVTATGTLQPVDTVSVGAQVSGLVKTIYADFNSQVKKGQLLAEIEPSIIKAQTEESRATLANMKSNLAYQQLNYDRKQKLFELGAISQADYQLATSQYQAARAAVANAAAQLRISMRTLSYTNIYSPVNGVVLNRNVSEGQTIASSFSAPTLFVIAIDLAKMMVRAAVDEADIGGVVAGQQVSFTVDAFPDDVFRGAVKDILLHASVSSNVVTYTTLINVDNKGLKLKPGMTASINIYSEEDSAALLIPSRALTFKPDSALLKNYTLIRLKREHSPVDSAARKLIKNKTGQRSFVWVKTGDTLTQRKIIAGINDDTNVKVIKGLTAADDVVTSAVAREVKAVAGAAQKSPFMPQMGRRRPANTPANR